MKTFLTVLFYLVLFLLSFFGTQWVLHHIDDSPVATCIKTNHDLSLACTIIYEGQEYRNVWEVKHD